MPDEIETFILGILFFIAILGFAYYAGSDSPVARDDVAESLCNRLTQSPQYDNCSQVGGQFSEQIEGCRRMGKRNISNTSIDLHYCEEFEFEVEDSRVTLRRKD